MNRSHRVLIVEDNEGDAKLVAHELARGGLTVSHERVDTAEAMRDALRRERWDVIISDWALPGVDARQAVRAAVERLSERPVLAPRSPEDHAEGAQFLIALHRALDAVPLDRLR